MSHDSSLFGSTDHHPNPYNYYFCASPSEAVQPLEAAPADAVSEETLARASCPEPVPEELWELKFGLRVHKFYIVFSWPSNRFYEGIHWGQGFRAYFGLSVFFPAGIVAHKVHLFHTTSLESAWNLWASEAFKYGNEEEKPEIFLWRGNNYSDRDSRRRHYNMAVNRTTVRGPAPANMESMEVNDGNLESVKPEEFKFVCGLIVEIVCAEVKDSTVKSDESDLSDWSGSTMQFGDPSPRSAKLNPKVSEAETRTRSRSRTPQGSDERAHANESKLQGSDEKEQAVPHGLAELRNGRWIIYPLQVRCGPCDKKVTFPNGATETQCYRCNRDFIREPLVWHCPTRGVCHPTG